MKRLDQVETYSFQHFKLPLMLAFKLTGSRNILSFGKKTNKPVFCVNVYPWQMRHNLAKLIVDVLITISGLRVK